MVFEIGPRRGAAPPLVKPARSPRAPTTVYVRRDGTIELETINRGESAARWVATLQGKKRLSVVDAPGGPRAKGLMRRPPSLGAPLQRESLAPGRTSNLVRWGHIAARTSADCFHSS